MLTLRRDQLEALATVPQEIFLRRVGKHLEAVFSLTLPEYQREFTSPFAQAELRKEMDLLFERNITSAYDIAAALELFNIFGVDVRSEPVRQTLDDYSLTAAEKLDRLYRITGLQEDP